MIGGTVIDRSCNGAIAVIPDVVPHNLPYLVLFAICSHRMLLIRETWITNVCSTGNLGTLKNAYAETPYTLQFPELNQRFLASFGVRHGRS